MLVDILSTEYIGVKHCWIKLINRRVKAHHRGTVNVDREKVDRRNSLHCTELLLLKEFSVKHENA